MAAAAIEATVDFWFGPLTADGVTTGDQWKLWFTKDAGQDEEIRRRFRTQTERALTGELDDWQQTPTGRLALILTLDQFTRNIYRDTPAAFSGDPQALTVAQAALAVGEDQELPIIQRVFLYLPLEHAESLDMQNESVRRFEQLAKDAPTAHRPMFQSFLDYAIAHRDVILEFGRFPHRNAELGRESTAAEQAYLDKPGAGF
ncbi:uncharacterized protein (DUF924 family) [Natronocella acetinitrilica]|jgi:uncharacterized protein (DUF924 family)|uniref:Uncharacterized protein (DUF924 family) n=1 Tax=Natronocella acetinitrilica TaxID=414046 RepID=A0AAE3KH51_9GAMM|nr:DUF924 family protein [Natronocella acetinitrilica]MCP1675982.1 uncharacterized protein (DUF924 family) [Natronocella acetinitrilica]